MLSTILMTVCPYMKLDTSTFTLNELVQLFEAYLARHARQVPLTQSMQDYDKEVGRVSFLHQLPIHDPLFLLIKRIYPEDYVSVQPHEFLLHFCGPVDQEVPFVVI